MITRDEWLKALSDAVPEPEQNDDVLTSTEVAALLNVDFGTARRRLKLMLKRGTAIQTTKRIRVGNGIRAVSAYRLKP